MRREHSRVGSGNVLQEVEKRALLSSEQREYVIEKLLQMGAKLDYAVQLEDTYFCLNSVKSFNEISMDQMGSYSLRLRKTIKDHKEEVSLNVKVITKEGDHQAWEEHEVKITSFEEMQAIIYIIGYKQFIFIKKIRDVFKWKELSIFVEDIEDFGLALEVEILTTKENISQAKEKIDNFLFYLGISNEQIVPKSITFILMQQKSSF